MSRGWVTETIRFEEVKRMATKNLPCPHCGKRVKRQRTFRQTLNPWNKRADGQVKSRQDIWDDLAAEIAEWRESPVPCANCPSGSPS